MADAVPDDVPSSPPVPGKETEPVDDVTSEPSVADVHVANGDDATLTPTSPATKSSATSSPLKSVNGVEEDNPRKKDELPGEDARKEDALPEDARKEDALPEDARKEDELPGEDAEVAISPVVTEDIMPEGSSSEETSKVVDVPTVQSPSDEGGEAVVTAATVEESLDLDVEGEVVTHVQVPDVETGSRKEPSTKSDVEVEEVPTQELGPPDVEPVEKTPAELAETVKSVEEEAVSMSDSPEPPVPTVAESPVEPPTPGMEVHDEEEIVGVSFPSHEETPSLPISPEEPVVVAAGPPAPQTNEDASSTNGDVKSVGGSSPRAASPTLSVQSAEELVKADDMTPKLKFAVLMSLIDVGQVGNKEVVSTVQHLVSKIFFRPVKFAREGKRFKSSTESSFDHGQEDKIIPSNLGVDLLIIRLDHSVDEQIWAPTFITCRCFYSLTVNC